ECGAPRLPSRADSIAALHPLARASRARRNTSMARMARSDRDQAENSGMRDPWLQRGARRRTSAEQTRQLRVLRIPNEVRETLQQWAASPAALEPLLRLIRAIVVSNAAHQARPPQPR